MNPKVRSSRQEVFFKKRVLRYFAKFTGKHLCQSPFFNSFITSGGDLCHAGTSKLISETNRWTGPCVIQILLEGRSETIIHHWCGNGKYTTVLCFGISGLIPGSLFHFTNGVWRVSGSFSHVLRHCGIRVCFSFWCRWDYVTSRRYHSTVTV